MLVSLVQGAILGAIAAVWSVWRGRRRLDAPGAIVAWEEKVVSAWRQDPAAALSIGAHAGTIAWLAVLAAIDASRLPAAAPDPNHSEARLLLGVLAGAVLSFPLARRIAPRMPVALHPESVNRGPAATHWSAFGHFTADSTSRTIKLYGRRTPQIAREVWKPPTDEIFRAAVSATAERLAATPSGPIPWYRTRAAFLAAMGLATLPAVAAAHVVFAASVTWAPLFYAGAAFVVCLAGVVVIRLYQVD